MVLVLDNHIALKRGGCKGSVRAEVASVDDDAGLLRQFALYYIVGNRCNRSRTHGNKCKSKGARRRRRCGWRAGRGAYRLSGVYHRDQDRLGSRRGLAQVLFQETKARSGGSGTCRRGGCEIGRASCRERV